LAELRWILLVLGTLSIGVIWWWSARRSAQAPGNAELRESSVVPVPTLAAQSAEPNESPAIEKVFAEVVAEKAAAASALIEKPPAAVVATEKHASAGGEPRLSEVRASPIERAEWSVSPLEPLSIRTVDFDEVPELDSPMMAHADPLEVTQDLGAMAASKPPKSVAREIPTAILTPAPGAPPPPPVSPARIPTLAPPSTAPGAPQGGTARPRLNPESSDRLDAVAPANSSEKQKIVALRVCAVGDKRWTGAALMSTLEVHGLAFGRYQVFHRKHIDGRSVFCVAGLGEPGTFDMAQMPNEQYRGVSMFAVLPGPLEPLQTVDALFATARDLAKDLSGTVQDAKGIPFSPQRVAALREDVARFQAQLG
jgi:cell division protein ZipA